MEGAASQISELAREALIAAQAEVGKARRMLWLAAVALALLHLLTVQPYLRTTREIATLEATMAANAGLLAQLEPEIARLRQAGGIAGEQLQALLTGATQEMIGAFARLRGLVARAQQGEVPPAWSQAAAPPMQMGQMQQVAPLPDQQRSIGAQIANLPAPASAQVDVSPAEHAVLKALADGAPDAYERLIDFARSDIVRATYAQVQEDWARNVRPAYLQVLDLASERARRAAEEGKGLAPDTAAALVAAAAALAEKRAALADLEIRHDATVDAALGSDWWRTVEGKGAFADAVAQSIDAQMQTIAGVAAAPLVAIERTLALQQQLKAELTSRQDVLAQQFAQAQKQLATLSGAGGVLPIDLVGSIGLFPLLLGLILAALLFRAAQARRQAALAAEDLANSDAERDTRDWLVRRALSGSARSAGLATLAIAVATLAWIALAAAQLAAGDGAAPLPPWQGVAIGGVAVAAAAAWDVATIRRLAATQG